MFDQPHKTAIKRNALSLPMRHLNDKGLLKGRVLDFGCGKGGDVERLGIEGFDPFHRPTMPKGKFDTITCNYVLNVISDKDGKKVLDEIRSKLKKNGKAYISVRRDIKVDTDSQRVVHLDLPVVKSNSGFCMYLLEK